MTETARYHQNDSTARHTPLTPPPSFGAGGGGVPPVTAAQADAVSEWLKWHAVELVGIGVPLALALLVSVWFLLLAVPAAGLWATHGTRQARRRAQLRGADRDALTSPDDTPGATSEENQS